MEHSIEKQVRATYFSLRTAMAIVALAFPLLLWAGGNQYGFSLRESMSAYYHATAQFPLPDSAPCQSSALPSSVTSVKTIYAAGSMRNYFVGLMFAIGMALYVNKGYTKMENIVLNLAGIFAVGIALFPMPWSCAPSARFTPHGVFAILFFLCIAFVCAICSESTVELLEASDQSFYRTAYRVLACIMIASPLTAYIFNVVTGQKSYIFWAELFGIYSFATYWLVKSKEITKIGGEKNAIEKIRKHAKVSADYKGMSKPQTA